MQYQFHRDPLFPTAAPKIVCAAVNLMDTTEPFRGVPLSADNSDYNKMLADWQSGAATVYSSTGVPLPWGSEPS